MIAPTTKDESLLTLQEAAEIAEVSPGTIRAWIRRYELPSTRALGQVMLSEKAFYVCERNRRDSPQRRVIRTTASKG